MFQVISSTVDLKILIFFFEEIFTSGILNETSKTRSVKINFVDCVPSKKIMSTKTMKELCVS